MYKCTLVLAIIGVLLSGCAPTAGPKETLRAYFTAIAEGDAARAFDLLSTRSRRTLDDLAARESGGRKALDVFRARITTGGPGAVPWITPTTVLAVRIDVISEEAESATLRVASPLGSADVRMLREDGDWVVDLTI